MTEEISSNTAGEHQNPRKGKPRGKAFTKGDPRINRKGRPKSFDALRDLAQQIGAEQAEQNGKPYVIGDHVATNAEMTLRLLMREKPEKFLEFAYGRVPQPVEISGRDGAPVKVESFDYAAAIAPIAPRPAPDSKPPGETADSGDGQTVGENADGE